ncbi:MAG: bifunctional (p)ppGpp synthetase/guanosine-3',5'-bis(diphosphate) 3'-pyrophosphohydrolase [Lactobacillus sp.]|nr:bifunctional (p)ppGpp synthetase/guanosine-3',5'-bis(diphosphate) 3'-pyrophosphohydrolase [Lactobacillus sp.]
MSKYVEMTHQEVIDACKKYMNKDQVAFVERAYEFANEAHKNQTRASGQPYIIHPTQVAGTLANLKLDVDTVAAGFLHDTVEDTPTTNEDIKNLFGEDVAFIVDGVTKLNKFEYKSHQEFLAENHRKMLIAMAQDLRVIMVKLADRMHNMHTLEHLRPDKQRRIASETMDIYAPLADRLGIGTIKWELEDISFHYLNPEAYYRIVGLMDVKRTERERYIEEATSFLKKTLDDLGISYDIYGRPKHIYSIYKKMVEKHKDFDEIYDLLAVRVIVKSVKDCYAVLGAVHTKWKPIPGRFKDYIAVPKANGYQSLHTTIIGPGGRPLEIQIRTEQMHQIAEYGVAAHWAYKRGDFNAVESTDSGRKLDLVREILELQDEASDADEFMKSVKSDIFSDRVYVFTPKGEVYELPKGSSTLDFAFAIHTQVGEHAIGAKINNKMVPLDYKLKTGDVVSILTQASAFPSKDWMGMVKTVRARNKIRRFIKSQERDQAIEHGEKEVANILRAEGYEASKFLDKEHIEELLSQLNYHTRDELFATVGFGDISAISIVNKLTAKERKAALDKEQKEKEAAILNQGQNKTQATDISSTDKTAGRLAISVQGVSDLMQHLAKCCNPVPGDQIIGYVTKGRGVTIHRLECPNITPEALSQGRVIDVAWENWSETTKQLFNANIEVFGYNRSNLLSDVINKLNSLTSNITNISGKVNDDNVAHIYITLSVKNATQLQDILQKLRDLPDVYETKRSIN